MKRVIKGRVWDTQKSGMVAAWANSFYPHDYRYCEENLYCTWRGNWFVHILRAGPESDTYHFSEIYLVPLSEDEAFKWLQDHDFTSELEEHFGSRIEEA